MKKITVVLLALAVLSTVAAEVFAYAQGSGSSQEPTVIVTFKRR